MAKSRQPEAPSTEPAPQTPQEPAAASEPISIAEPDMAPRVAPTVAIEVTDKPPADLGITSREMEQLHDEARRENQKKDFHDKVMDARRPKPEPVFNPPALAPRMVEQLNAELAAGAAQVAKHAAHQAKHGTPPQLPEPNVKPVFRPGDYVPDPKKGQGRIVAQTLK
jgi:hypothetical protein